MAALSWLLYTLGKLFFWIIFRVIFRTIVRGRERIPADGGLLVVSNHISFADPLLAGTCLPRRVSFMAMVELFRLWWLGPPLRLIRAIPVDRSRPDSTAARESIRRLREGECVLIFPEAGIRLDKKSVLGGDPVFRPGAGLIGLLGQAAILPVVLRDARRTYVWRNWLRRATLGVTFGRPFCLWIPLHLPVAQRRRLAREVIREQLLKTVELT